MLACVTGEEGTSPCCDRERAEPRGGWAGDRSRGTHSLAAGPYLLTHGDPKSPIACGLVPKPYLRNEGTEAQRC